MRYYQFADNTVLCNYAAINRLDWLDDFLGNLGRWTQAVYAEAVKSAKHLPPLLTLLDCQLLGEPVEADDEDAVNSIRRNVFGAPSVPATKHLGESETYYILQAYEEFEASAWITDDTSAYDLAEANGITVFDTRDTLMELVRRGLVSPEEAYAAMLSMRAANRFPRNMPNSVEDFIPS